MCTSSGIPLVEFIYLVFTHMPGESYCRWLYTLSSGMRVNTRYINDTRGTSSKVYVHPQVYLWWSLCTLCLHTCQVRVTVGNSGLCCWTYITYLERWLTPLFFNINNHSYLPLLRHLWLCFLFIPLLLLLLALHFLPLSLGLLLLCLTSLRWSLQSTGR